MPTSELSAKQSQRNDQAREIMQQLIAEGLFTKDEAAEIVFSDATVVYNRVIDEKQ